MKTFYIDVYFLINFSVDLLALYFASLFFRIPTRLWRLCLSASVGAGAACAAVLLSLPLGVGLPLLSFLLLFMMRLATGRVGALRLLRFLFGFLLLELLLGGVVYFSYGLLEDLFEKPEIEANYGAENRGMLILAIVVFLSVGVLRLAIAAASSARSERVCEVSFSLFERRVRVCALVDSGNLLRDPLDGTAVMLWKADAAAGHLPPSLLGISGAEKSDGMKSRLRLIPVHRGNATRMLCGYRTEDAEVILEKRKERVKLIIAIDEEDGTYGGYGALLPSAVLDAC